MRRGIAIGAGSVLLLLALVGCVDRQITVPYGADASCNVQVHNPAGS